MESDYLRNLQKNKTPEAKASKAKFFNSIKGPQVIPIPDVLHIVPPSLHISLKVGLAIVKLLEKHCTILDEDADESALAIVGDEIFVEESGLEEGEETMEEADNPDDSNPPEGSGGAVVEEQGQSDVGLEVHVELDMESGEAVEDTARFDLGQDREERVRAGLELEAAVDEVQRRQGVVEVLAKTILERKVVLDRITLSIVEDWDGVEELSKTHAKYNRVISAC